MENTLVPFSFLV